MNTISVCAVCNSTELHPYLEVRDFFLTGEPYRILTCKHCGCGLTDPQPGPDEVGRYYRSEAYISHSASQKGILNKLYLLARNVTLQRKYKLVKAFSGRSSGSILDVGCGSGELLHYFQERSWQTRGIEPDESTRRGAGQKYHLQIEGSESLAGIPSRSQHVISFWHSLEHIADLHGILAQVKRIVRPDGVLMIAVPNYTSLDAACYGPHWAAWDTPRHLYHFTPRALDHLVRHHGMKIQQTLPMKLDAYYVSMLSERYRHGWVNYPRAFWNGWRSNLHARSHKNACSSLIYVIKPENT